MYFVRNKWAMELINELDTMEIHILNNVEKKSKFLLRTINSISSKQEDGLTYLEECFQQLLQTLDISLDRYSSLKQHWEFFFEGTKKRLEKPEFDYAKDINSFKRLFRQHAGVVVNTCHGIKGEEFHTVIAFGLLHGYIPNWNEVDKDSASRKLLYVICSRTKKHLHLISEQGRTTKSQKPYRPTGHLQRCNYSYDD
jgi:superfamily I DNA/RNA helicase